MSPRAARNCFAFTSSPLATAKAPRARFWVGRVPLILSTTRWAWSQSAPSWPYSIFSSDAASTKKDFTSSSSGNTVISSAAEASAFWRSLVAANRVASPVITVTREANAPRPFSIRSVWP